MLHLLLSETATTHQDIHNLTLSHNFRGWHYAEAQFELSDKAELERVCIDTGCTITLIDREFLKTQKVDHTSIKQ